MLEERPGAYIFLGGGDETHTHSVHHPEYDFNDETLTTGASLWAALSKPSCRAPVELILKVTVRD